MFVGWTIALRTEGSVDSANRLAMSLISIGAALVFSVINRRRRKRIGRGSGALFAAAVVCAVSGILWGASAYFEHKRAALRQHMFQDNFRHQFGL